jgi:hypothetical protein
MPKWATPSWDSEWNGSPDPLLDGAQAAYDHLVAAGWDVRPEVNLEWKEGLAEEESIEEARKTLRFAATPTELTVRIAARSGDEQVSITIFGRTMLGQVVAVLGRGTDFALTQSAFEQAREIVRDRATARESEAPQGRTEPAAAEDKSESEAAEDKTESEAAQDALSPRRETFRTVNDEWKTDHWRGSFEALASALDRTRAELVAFREGAKLYESVKVEWEDGEQEFNSVADFRSSNATIATEGIKSIWGYISEVGDKSTPTVSVRGDQFGLRASASGRNAAFVHGVIKILGNLLADGAVEEFPPERRPSAWWEKLLLGLALVYAAAAIALPLILGVSLLGAISIAALGIGYAILTIWWLRSIRRKPAPGLQIVSGEEQEAVVEHATGPVWALKDWLEAHPVVAFLAAFLLLGVAPNLVSYFITNA